jgi:mannosylglycerate hydrolase
MKTIHIISHTHWDREWYRTFQQFRLRLVHLVDGLLDILDNDPQYKNFMLDGQTIVLDDYLQMRPENEEKLRRYVQSGRITIGPWHILPDEFLVSPEATIRNLLQGSRTCSKFGPKMMVGYIPDPFGHIGQLPQILRGFGIDSACLQRGLSTEPCEFWWQSPDGSRVLMAYLRNGYGNAAELTDGDLGLYTSEVRRLADALIPNAASPHLLLMWGTDHMEPPPGTSKMIAYANNNLGGDTLIHSTLTEYIAGVRATIDLDQLPIISGELRSPQRHPLLPNVLSARIWIKQRNRAAETLLENGPNPSAPGRSG